MPDYTRFKGVVNIGDAQLGNQIPANMIEFCKWGMLCIGGFWNVNLTTTLPYGGNPATLRPCDDNRYPAGLIWEGYKNNWVWETGVEYSSQPIQISGIYVNGTFYPTGTNNPTYAYNISYPLGRVIFNNPIPTNSVVQCEYSYHQYGFYPADTEWYHTLLDGLNRIDDYQYNWQGSGIWSVFSDNRISFPAVVVESVPIRKFVPKSLGGGQWCYQSVNFTVFADDPSDRNILVDILTYQNEKRFFMFDQNAMAASGSYPLNAYGYLVNPQLTYPTLVNNYYWTDAIIWNVTAGQNDNESPNVYIGKVSMTLEVDMPGI